MSRGTASPSGNEKRNGFSGIDKILRERVASGFWKPNDRLPTEKELAEELNVCQATVQRHLRELQKEGLIWGRRGKGRFVVGLQQRPRTGNIGVVLFDSRHMANPAMSGMVASVGAIAAEAGRGLRIFIGNDLPKQSVTSPHKSAHGSAHEAFLGSPNQLGVDGLIILTQRITPETIRQLAGSVPVVCSHLLTMPEIPCIVVDAVAAVFEAMRHLLQQGHHRITLMAKDFTDAFGRAMREGARLAMSTLASDADREKLQFATPTELSETEGYRLGLEFLSKADRPTAIICADDSTAMGMLRAIDELHLRVPADVSLVSWNNTLTERKPVSITSICFDRAEAGARLCRRLLECIDHPERRFEPEFLRPQLVLRDSTAARVSE